MYIPLPYKVTDRGVIKKFLRENSLGIIFSVSGNEDYHATSTPLFINDEFTELKGHISAKNEQWKGLDGKKVLVVFQGPGHYISPPWYGKDKSVPTWNHAVVQMEGLFSIVDEAGSSTRILDDLVSHHENTIGGDWSVDWKDHYYSAKMRSIIVFCIAINKLEAMWMFSQDRTKEEMESAARELSQIESPDAGRVSEMIKERLKQR